VKLRLLPLERRIVPNGTISLISTSIAGPASATAGGQSEFGMYYAGTLLPGQSQISSDGRYVVFASTSANLISGQIDKNNGLDVFLYDRTIDQISLVSHTPVNQVVTANGGSHSPIISADGRYIVFSSTAPDLLNGLISESIGLYLYDRLNDSIVLVSHAYDNALKTAAGPANFPRISTDGNWIVFQTSTATNLVSGFTTISAGDTTDIYLYDRLNNSNRLVSHVAGMSAKGVGLSDNPLVSADGRYVAYDSFQDAMVPGIATDQRDVFLYDRVTDMTLLVSHVSGSTSEGGDAYSYVSSLSADGKYVSFMSAATNLVNAFVDGNGSAYDVYRFDRISKSNVLVSHATGSLTTGGNGSVNYGSRFGSISADGSTVVFISSATDLAAGINDVNADGDDIFAWDALTGNISLVSHSFDSPDQTANNSVNYPQISADGRMVVYRSPATDLVADYVDGNPTGYRTWDVFATDRITGNTVLVSHQLGTTTFGSNQENSNYMISANGKVVAFNSKATDLVGNDLNQQTDVMVCEAATGNIALASQSAMTSITPGGETNTQTYYGIGHPTQQMSDDGRFVVYNSAATNVVPGQVDNNFGSDVFLYDRQTKSTQLVSHAYSSLMTAGNFRSRDAVISGDGRYVAFMSEATDLVSGFVDNNGPNPNNSLGMDIFLWDRMTGASMLVSHRFDSLVSGGNRVSSSANWQLFISANGQYVLYRSQASDLINGFVDGNGADSQGYLGLDVFLYDRNTGANVLVNQAVTSSMTSGNGQVNEQFLSNDGRYVAYTSQATDLVSGYSGGGRQIFLFDSVTGTNALVSHSTGGPTTAANGSAARVRFSGDGKFIVYNSTATNLVTGIQDTNAVDDVFLYDRLNATTTLVSHTASAPLQAVNSFSEHPSISADGRFVAYLSDATNLVSGFVDQNGQGQFPFGNVDVFLYDRVSGENVLASHSFSSALAGGNESNSGPELSGDGRYIAWNSDSTNVIDGAGPVHWWGISGQIYRYDRLLGNVKLLSRGSENALEYGNSSSEIWGINSTGSAVLMISPSDNFVTSDFNGWTDLFAYVTPPPRVQSIQINDGSPQRSVIRSITISFDDAVFLTGNPFSMVRDQGGEVGGVQWTVGSENKSVMLTFSGANTEFGSLADGNYTLTIFGSQVSGVGQLDGNGDGIGGDDYVFNFHRLFGDGNGDKRVDSADFALFRQVFGIPGNVFDFNNDGQTNSTDFVEFRKRFGLMI